MITLGLLRAFSDAGLAMRAAKSGPDYIDPRFHEAACGNPCMNLDAWAMPADRIIARAGTGPLIVEGAMGLFDGAPPDGRGSCADLARHLQLPVVLVVDAGRMAQSIAAIVAGFANFDSAVRIAGVIANNVGSARHEVMLRDALARIGMPVFGAVHRQSALATPSRHLGLVQAQERSDLEQFIAKAARIVSDAVDITALSALTAPQLPTSATFQPPPAQNIAIAQDAAFAFAYPHLLHEWQAAGAQITPFSPLGDDAVPAADLTILPGGYPELYAGQIASNATFMQSLNKAAQTSDIYGECGGYMTLGEVLIDADGTAHKMAGLLPLTTSFAQRKRQLGYRKIQATQGPFQGAWNAHEFHYATTISAQGQPLFAAQDATGAALPDMGLVKGRVYGSFAHIIDAC